MRKIGLAGLLSTLTCVVGCIGESSSVETDPYQPSAPSLGQTDLERRIEKGKKTNLTIEEAREVKKIEKEIENLTGYEKVSLQKSDKTLGLFSGIADHGGKLVTEIEVNCKDGHIIHYTENKSAFEMREEIGDSCRTKKTYHSEYKETPEIVLDTAVDEISDWSGISAERIWSMTKSERRDLSARFLAYKLKKSVNKIHSMTPDEVFDEGLNQLADKWGISHEEAKKLAELQQKFDSGHSLSTAELGFISKMNLKTSQKR